MRDPQFIAEATKMKMDLSISTGEEAQAHAASVVDTPADIVERAKAILQAK
jgi:hypothetical protein